MHFSQQRILICVLYLCCISAVDARLAAFYHKKVDMNTVGFPTLMIACHHPLGK